MLKDESANRREVTRRIPGSGIFNTWCLDYAGSLPATKRGNKFIIFGVEQTSRWPVTRMMPPPIFHAEGTMKSIEKEIITPFGSPEYILSDNNLKFDCMAVHDLTKKHNINWKYTSTCNPQRNGIAERMVGTLKKSIQLMMRAERLQWDECLDRVLYGYRGMQNNSRC